MSKTVKELCDEVKGLKGEMATKPKKKTVRDLTSIEVPIIKTENDLIAFDQSLRDEQYYQDLFERFKLDVKVSTGVNAFSNGSTNTFDYFFTTNFLIIIGWEGSRINNAIVCFQDYEIVIGFLIECCRYATGSKTFNRNDIAKKCRSYSKNREARKKRMEEVPDEEEDDDDDDNDGSGGGGGDDTGENTN